MATIAIVCAGYESRSVIAVPPVLFSSRTDERSNSLGNQFRDWNQVLLSSQVQLRVAVSQCPQLPRELA